MFQNNIIEVGILSALDFARNDYFFSTDVNRFFQTPLVQTNDNITIENLRTVAILAYNALLYAINNRVENNASTFPPNWFNDKEKMVDITYCGPFPFYDYHTNSTSPIYKSDITIARQAVIVKMMALTLKNCPSLLNLKCMIDEPQPQQLQVGNAVNYTLPYSSLFSLCKRMMDSMIYYDSNKITYNNLVKIIVPDTLSVTGANVSTSFSDQIPKEKEYYMLLPYADIIDPNVFMPNSLSYMDYGVPILQSLNKLLELRNGKVTLALNDTDFVTINNKISTIFNQWIMSTIFLLVSDSGKYYGTNSYAGTTKLHSHYVQTINSSLVGSPFSNIITNLDNIRFNIFHGKQADGVYNPIGKQLIESIISNRDDIGKAILISDPSRGRVEDGILFKKNDMLTIFISISGTIGNNIKNINISTLFDKNVDPLDENNSSFKKFILSKDGTKIKPIVYAIVVPINNEIEMRK